MEKYGHIWNRWRSEDNFKAQNKCVLEITLTMNTTLWQRFDNKSISEVTQQIYNYSMN